MKVACVLFGQPRDYMTGYNNLMKFFKDQSGVDVEFFYHFWTLNKGESYCKSPWRKDIDPNTLSYIENLEEHLKSLYNPLSYEYENQSDGIDFDIKSLMRTISYRNMPPLKQSNIYNTIFQMYSRNKARNLLNNYIEKTNAKYDYVVFTRFDIDELLNVNVSDLNMSSYVYLKLSWSHCQSIVFHDKMIIAPTDIFLKWFDIFDKLKNILENPFHLDKMRTNRYNIDINPEELIFSKYILEFDNLDKVKYVS